MSVYDINGNSIFSYYDSIGTSVSSLYDVNGTLITGGGGKTFDDSTTVTTIFQESIDGIPQGGCIDSNQNVYVCIYNKGYFVKYNLATEAESKPTYTSGAYGHANGMTYNPNTGYLYIAGMSNSGNVYKLDTSLNLIETLYARDRNNQAFNCWNIAYDRLSRRFITMSGGVIYFMNDSFVCTSTATYTESEWTDTRQDIETDGEYIYCVSHNPAIIHVFSMSGTHIKAITNSGFAGEPESLMYDWTNDIFYMEGLSNGLAIRRTDFIEEGTP